MKSKDIEKALKKLKLDNKKVFTLVELEAIVRESKADLHSVMYYLRFKR